MGSASRRDETAERGGGAVDCCFAMCTSTSERSEGGASALATLRIEARTSERTSSACTWGEKRPEGEG